jgi:hypothetical protein
MREVDGVGAKRRRSRPTGAILRTRLRRDPPPEHAPRPADFIKPDGSRLYADARPLAPGEQGCLDRLAPKARERGEHCYWEAPFWKPESYRRELSAVDNTPGPPEADIPFRRRRAPPTA